MANGYLIDGQIEFWPASNLLINIQIEGKEITLPSPGSRCMELLLSTPGLVSQQEIFQFVWGEDAASITPNNLYQNICQLRRALKNITANEEEWIITVPRRGFHFNSNISIKTLTERGNINSPAGKLEDPVIPTQIVSADATAALRKNTKWIRLSLFIMLLISLLLINRKTNPSDNIVDRFSYYAKIDNCKLYYNNDMHGPAPHIKIIKTMKPNCQKFPYVYITAYIITRTSSILSCDRPIENNNPHCVSRLVIGFQSS